MPAIPIIAVAAAGIGAAAVVTGTVMSGIAGGKAADLSESVGASNAAILRRRAGKQRKVMGYDMGQFDTKAGRFLGAGDLAIAGSGIEASGSAKLNREETIQNLATDRENLWDKYDTQIQETLAEARQQEEYGQAAGEIQQLNNMAGVFQGVSQTASFINQGAGWWG